MRTKGAADVRKWNLITVVPMGLVVSLASACAGGGGQTGASDGDQEGTKEPFVQKSQTQTDDAAVPTPPEFDPCADDPCEHDGVCRVDNDFYVCACSSGWTGENCEEPAPPLTTLVVDPPACEPACQNGGECVDGACVCPEGCSGVACEIIDPPNVQPDDPCASQPCSNGGFCVVSGESFSCACPEGFSGPTCELEEEPCEE
ncbi:MAG: calcium-binding EGF-like domain-containing protein [Myxococcales bacterium]